MNRITDYSKLKTNITDWMTDYIKSSGMNCFVVGVSGGIDSAVASTLAAETNYNVSVSYTHLTLPTTLVV